MIADTITAYLSAPSLTLPQRKPVSASVLEVSALLAGNEGATYSLYFGDTRNQRLYAVSIYPEQGRKVPGSLLSQNILRTFILENENLLVDPRNCIGIWYDAEQDATYLDITTTLPDRETAVQLGRMYNQIGIYDLERLEVIETGGSGDELEGLPPIYLRLPALERNDVDGDNENNEFGDSS